MSWDSWKKKDCIFYTVYFVSRKLINICVLSQSIVHWIHIKKQFFILFYWLFLILSKASVFPLSEENHIILILCLQFLYMGSTYRHNFNLKALSGLRQFLAAESSLKMMKNTSYFTSKALFVLKIFKFLSWLFGHVSKRLD